MAVIIKTTVSPGTHRPSADKGGSDKPANTTPTTDAPGDNTSAEQANKETQAEPQHQEVEEINKLIAEDSDLSEVETQGDANGNPYGSRNGLDDNISLDGDPLSYESFVQSRVQFRQSGGAYTNEFNAFDVPNQTFFKICFHFLETADTSRDNWKGQKKIDRFAGFLGPTWLSFQHLLQQDSYTWPPGYVMALWEHPSAWAFLKMNGEDWRAAYLQRFVELLSNINMYSPWYFQKIKGLDNAMTRKIANSREFMMNPEPQVLTIECLEDSLDNRIGTLLDLYRSIVWDWQNKREIVPHNLRKFDMTVFVYSVGTSGLNVPEKNTKRTYNGSKSEFQKLVDSGAIGASEGMPLSVSSDIANYGTIGGGENKYVTSFKAFEFTGCEFDYNSVASGWGDVDNAQGSNQTYSIQIMYDNCEETRFNEFMNLEISEFLGTDLQYQDYVDAINKGFADSVNAYADKLLSNDSRKYSRIVSMGDVKDANSMRNVADMGVLDGYAGGGGGGILSFGNKLTNTINQSFHSFTDPIAQGWNNFNVNNYINKAVSSLERKLDSKLSHFLGGNIFGHTLSQWGKTIGSFLGGNYDAFRSDQMARTGHEKGQNMFNDGNNAYDNSEYREGTYKLPRKDNILGGNEIYDDLEFREGTYQTPRKDSLSGGNEIYDDFEGRESIYQTPRKDTLSDGNEIYDDLEGREGTYSVPIKRNIFDEIGVGVMMRGQRNQSNTILGNIK